MRFLVLVMAASSDLSARTIMNFTEPVLLMMILFGVVDSMMDYGTLVTLGV